MIKKWTYLSIQYKVLSFFIILIILPLAVVGSVSYMKSSAALKQQISELNLNTVNQVASSIERIFQDTWDTSMYLLLNENIRDYLSADSSSDASLYEKKYIDAYNTLMFLLVSKPYNKSTYLESFSGISMDTLGAKNPISQDVYNRIFELQGRYYWYKNEIITNTGKPQNVYSLIRIYRDYTNLDELGIMKINVSEDYIIEMLKHKTIGEKSGYLILNNNKEVISSTTNKNQSWFENNLLDVNDTEGYYEAIIEGEKYLITYYYIESADWLLVNYIMMDELLKNNQSIKKYTVIVVIVCFIACAILVAWLLTDVIKPIKKMSRLMKNIENEDFDVHINIRGNDEIAVLAKNFNKMSSKLKQLITREYNLRISQKEAELKALQAQINPHFLYNTLDTICWMSRINKDFETAKIVEALSNMFRLSLNRGNEITTVQREVNHLKNYIIIQQKRYEDMIAFEINVKEDVLNAKTVKLILQPMVENAIYHGIEILGGKGVIWIDIYKKERNLICTIIDSGIGVDINEINQLLAEKNDDYSNRGFAIKNVNDRIKLYFGEEYGIEFSLRDNGGTIVTITQPLMEGRNSLV